MAISKQCSNCAHACMLQNKNVLQTNVLFCTYWVETENSNHSCTEFLTHEEARFVHFHDPKSNGRTIRRFKYPLTQPFNFNDFEHATK
jgi:hypothetical protein